MRSFTSISTAIRLESEENEYLPATDLIYIYLTERISFHDLYPTPHKERGKKVRRKIFTDPLITADENMKIIESAHEKSLKKEQLEEEKSKVVKEHFEE